jgi:tmRNA-binding protein
MECFDKEKSTYKISQLTKTWRTIEKLVLHNKHLSEIPLKERLVIKSKETSVLLLYHKSIVDIIMSVNPDGVSFIPVEEWK